jgi:hypothetical protein
MYFSVDTRNTNNVYFYPNGEQSDNQSQKYHIDKICANKHLWDFMSVRLNQMQQELSRKIIELNEYALHVSKFGLKNKIE